MDWSIITPIIGALLGGGSLVGAFMSFTLRKANKRKAEAEAKVEEFASFHNQIEELHSMLKFERERNRELMQINIEKEDRIQDKDKFIGQQTLRLRETQDSNYKLQLENSDLKLQIKDEQCKKHGCPYREPENVYSKRAKLQLNIVGVDFKALPPSETATIVDVEIIDEDDNTNHSIED